MLQPKMFDSATIPAVAGGACVGTRSWSGQDRTDVKAAVQARRPGARLGEQEGIKSHGAPKSQMQVRLAYRI